MEDESVTTVKEEQATPTATPPKRKRGRPLKKFKLSKNLVGKISSLNTDRALKISKLNRLKKNKVGRPPLLKHKIKLQFKELMKSNDDSETKRKRGRPKLIKTENNELNESASATFSTSSSVSMLKHDAETKLTHKTPSSLDSDIIELNVGGTYFSTLKSTLIKKIKKYFSNDYYKPNLFEKILKGEQASVYDNQGAIFIDRSSTYFDYILNYLRISNTLSEFKIPSKIELDSLKIEAEFYNIEGLIGLINFNSLATNIINSAQAKQLYGLCEFSEHDTFKLIYSASKDGYSSQDFHSKCDNVSNTLIIIKTTDNFIFGGYTEASWNVSGQYKCDDQAFIFSLKNNQDKPVKLKCRDTTYAICCESESGPIFGKHDIYICDNPNKNRLSTTNLVGSYSMSQLPDQAWKLKNLFSGTYHFLISDMEVYKKV